MDATELTHLLESVRDGRVDPAEAVRRLRWTVAAEPTGGFATVDLHRKLRCGFPEVIFGQGKTPEQIAAILQTLRRHGQGGLATRVSPEAAAHLREVFPEGEYNQLGRTFRIRGGRDEVGGPRRRGARRGETGGTTRCP